MYLDYITEYCELPPLNRPQFDEDSDTWDIHFMEKDGSDPICLPFETLEEANETLKQALELYHNEEDNQSN